MEELTITTVDENNHLVFGWANISINKDDTIPIDWSEDMIPPKVLERAAYNFVLKHRASGEMHEGGVVGHLIESVMFTQDKMQAMGIPVGIVPEGWWVGFYIPDDEVCAKIRSGEYKMFSIQGRYKKVKI